MSMSGTVIGAFQLVGYKEKDNNKFKYFVLNEILTEGKRQYLIPPEALLDTNKNQETEGKGNE